MRTYLSEVHGTFLQTLINLMNDYSASLLLYKDGYYNIDSNNHAELPENTFTTLQSDLKTSRDHLKSQIELLNTARSKISDLVSYSGSSHTKTIQHYNFIINDIKTLDESIKQYESNHASHDLSAFKELLASTKALLAEYSNRPRTVATYQSGDIGRLTNIERFATAYEAVANHLTNNAERLQAAQERDQVRFEALAAEERTKQGWIDLALGAVTIAVGLAAIVATAGAATPLVVGAGIVAGTGTVAYGASNVAEAGQDIYLGYKGDGKTLAINPIRDTLFMGNDKLYHQVGGLFSTASAVMIPIGQTQSVTKGLAEFAIGEVGGFVGGQAGYHGIKLLGGSEADAQRATFVGSILGGFAASSAASKFSLNRPSKEVPKVVSRSDNNFYSQSNHKGAPKAYIDADGNLVPANPNGSGSAVSHVRGGNSSKSPYISTTDLTVSNSPKHYGNQAISIKTRKLQIDIDAERIRGVEIITHDELVSQFTNKVQQVQIRYTNNPTPKNLRALNRANSDLQNIIRDGEVLIKGIVPKKYINYK
ncbi:hypothetical protein J5566_10215 [Streptococcus suis]|nr:hypothetical protein [Streptococcus suis]